MLLPYDGEVECLNFMQGAALLLDLMKSADVVNIGKKENKRSYYNIYMSFDIETSNVLNDRWLKGMPEKYKYFNFPYCWQCHINDTWVFGREIREFFEMLNIVSMHSEGYVVCFIQNIAFEYNNLADYFLTGVQDFERDIFFKNTATPLYLRYSKSFEFRCSKQLSMKSLAKMGDDIGIAKLTGDLDYDIPRYTNTPMSPEEMNYCYRDTYVLNRWIMRETENYCSHEGFPVNPAMLPLTSTGYVRHDVKKNFSRTRSGWCILKKTELSEEDYRAIRPAFWGGFTHQNFRYVGTAVPYPKHGDITSAYPYAFLKKFPYHLTHVQVGTTKEILLKNLEMEDRAVIAKVKFTNLHMKGGTIPYIPELKSVLVDPIVENGKVIHADECIITMCDIDLRIVLRNYNYDDIEVLDFYFGFYEDLPYSLVSTVIQYFAYKTMYKNVDGKELEYALSKAKLNGIYGLSATSLINSVIKILDDSLIADIQGEEYKPASVLPFQWAIWITAYTREYIYTMIEFMMEENAYLYSDTDSIFYIETPRIKKFIDEKNRKNLEFLREKQKLYYYLLPKSPDGIEQHLGSFLAEDIDKEGKSTIKEFCTIGAKRYYIMHDDGTYDITFSGLRATKRKKVDSKYVNGFNTDRLIKKYGNLHNAFLEIKKGSVKLDYVAGVDKLSNYNVRAPFSGSLCGYPVERPCSYTLYPMDINLSLNPTLKAFINNEVLYNEYE